MNNKKISQGFTLLETLVSIGIFALILVGPLTVISGSSVYARQTKDNMVSTYLAEESLELLQNRYSSLYLLCKKQPETAACDSLNDDETSGQIAWRVFKERIGSDGTQPSCFLSENPYGCSYDNLSMIGDVTSWPVRYVGGSEECKYLIEVSTTTGAYFPNSEYTDPGNSQGEHGGEVSNGLVLYGKRNMYVCKGLEYHIPVGSTIGTKHFERVLSVESLPTFETGGILSQYNDDLRITSTVKFKGVNGLTRTVTVVRFMHAQP